MAQLVTKGLWPRHLLGSKIVTGSVRPGKTRLLLHRFNRGLNLWFATLRCAIHAWYLSAWRQAIRSEPVGECPLIAASSQNTKFSFPFFVKKVKVADRLCGGL